MNTANNSENQFELTINIYTAGKLRHKCFCIISEGRSGHGPQRKEREGGGDVDKEIQRGDVA